ncbi:GNAT family N-acetyltransferase [Pseudozobellia thermophila]|uniref:Acetyltransferase (GNAT) family protein n=1 Tax=Pseudozobellia thermophila TaxID=192903 RepID=A0A1M6CQM0_9FLAO|nr:GNAT family N-acetyltransferase [Pseudozobellia thermophila]SHI63312.1 Acetyltransferase (GNAT) family protein [Pseudozobellia thermophila]
MDFIIREARQSDMPAVHRLIKELAVFEKEANAVDVTVDDLVAHGYGPNPLFHCFVGESDDEVVGMALVYNRYSTWKGPVVHLEDLIVTERMRGSGLGSALLSEVVRYAHDLGVKRICWEVLDWNEPAIKFYESKGAKVMRDWDVVQLDEAGIQAFLNQVEC